MSEKLPGVNWEQFEPYLRGDHDPNGASMDAPTINLPYRIAADIQNHVIREVERSGYIQDRAAREDIAWYFVNETLRHEYEPEDIAWQGLHHWQRIYGKGVQG